jgi:dinuclear metal center YbgI/SA1388 family protein
MKIKQITALIESIAPLSFQESYDNAGLIIGNSGDEVKGILITLDVTEAVIDEAIEKKLNMIVAHHPLIFGGLKKINGKNATERCVQKAIRNGIAIYAAHTNLDSVFGGVNSMICRKLGLVNCKQLIPVENHLKKLVTFVPLSHTAIVQESLFAAGAGTIGNYDSCSFKMIGEGTFRGNELTNPFAGQRNEMHTESESRIETIFPKHLQQQIVQVLIDAHPYEEVAYDIYPIDNQYPLAGTGMLGELEEAVSESDFLMKLKHTFACKVIKYTRLLGNPIKKVALCGGSGSNFLSHAIAAEADIFISGDFKYHQFFDAEGKIVIADIGHYESEQFTKEVFYELLTKNFPKFAVQLSEVETNPVNYHL